MRGEGMKFFRLPILALFLMMVTAFSTKSMEQKGTFVEKGEEKVMLEDLPDEIQAHITRFLTQAKNLKDAATNIRNFSKVNKRFNALINDSVVTGTLINLLAQQFKLVDPISAALALDTPGATQWLKDKRQWLKKNKSFAEGLWFEAINAKDIRLAGYIFEVFPLIINELSPKGNTALINAVYANDKNMVQFLVNNGADVNVKNNAEQTALEIAREQGYEEIEGIILDSQLEPGKLKIKEVTYPEGSIWRR